jgi:DNA polymerase-3 subunit delta
MKVSPSELSDRAREGLPPAILIYGSEPLLVEETLDSLRGILDGHQFDERVRLSVETGFNWDEVSQGANSMSLFSRRQCFELRMPTGRPADKGAAAIGEFCAAANTENLLVVICGRLDGRQLKSKWVKGIDKAGLTIDCGEVGANAFPSWLRSRLQSRGLRVENGVLEHLAYYLEGNLLAAAQEIDKLAVIASKGAVTLDIVNQSLGDQARFSTYALADTCLLGEASRATRILSSLRSEGIRPELVVWTLSREVRAMFRITGALEQGQPRGSVFKANRVWSRRESIVNAALKRFSMEDWCTMINRVTRLDRSVKGQAGPVSRDGIWFEIELLCIALAGADIEMARDPGVSHVTS